MLNTPLMGETWKAEDMEIQLIEYRRNISTLARILCSNCTMSGLSGFDLRIHADAPGGLNWSARWTRSYIKKSQLNWLRVTISIAYDYFLLSMFEYCLYCLTKENPGTSSKTRHPVRPVLRASHYAECSTQTVASQDGRMNRC
jgi:hypothetical protein